MRFQYILLHLKFGIYKCDIVLYLAIESVHTSSFITTCLPVVNFDDTLTDFFKRKSLYCVFLSLPS
jgi:hypothetical protein